MSQLDHIKEIITEQNQKLQQQFIRNCVDLASERVGGETLKCSDDFFAEMENLLKVGRGIFIDNKYTERGKWMDGWESRRSYGRKNRETSWQQESGEQQVNEQCHDWCIIRLGISGFIQGFDIDTNFFKGNAPQTVSVEACSSVHQPDKHTNWQIVLPQTEVNAHSQNLFEIASQFFQQSFTHVRLNMFPDGGIARFRVYGQAHVNWDNFVDDELIDLVAIVNGGKVLLVSDMFFSDKNNLIMPGRGKDMGDGWETKRRRDPGPDWSIIKLTTIGTVRKVIIDTHHFKGNFPDSFMLEGCISNRDDFSNKIIASKVDWCPIIEQTPLNAHREHFFLSELVNDKNQLFTHVRLSIFPDGGVSRMRVFGFRKKPDL